MINKISKYTVIFFILVFLLTIISFTFNPKLRRSTLNRLLVVHDFYQIKVLTKYAQTRDFLGASKQLMKYIQISKKVSSGKSSMFQGVFEAVDFVTSKASTQKDFNNLEVVFLELVKMDPDLYNARVWLARALSDTDYKTALVHLDKAIEISPSSEDAYREGIRIAQEKNDIFLAQNFCKQYSKSQLGGVMPLHVGNYFDASGIRNMAIQFLPFEKNLRFYTHSGIELNKLQNYEFVPENPVKMNGVNIYFSFLPGINIEIKEITIYSSGNIIKIPAKEFTISSKSAYLQNNVKKSSLFILPNSEDEILRLRYKETFENVEKLIISMDFTRLNLSNNFFCKQN